MGILIGQDSKIAQLRIALQSARDRNRELPHTMLSGSAGCGKTTLARHIADMCKVDFLQIVPDIIKDHKSTLTLLEELNHKNYDSKGNRTGSVEPTIIFIDEIHRMPLSGQEIFGIALEQFTLETGRPNSLFWVPYFPLIGATTMAGELSRPFLNRFKMSFVFAPYTFEDSCLIVKEHSDRLNIKITENAIMGIAKRGRGIPRTIVGFIERARDLVLAIKGNTINSAAVDATFSSLGIDKLGFSDTEIAILQALYDNEKAIGLETLSIIVNENTKTLKNELEPFLIRAGFMIRSGSGRLITRKGREYLEEGGYAGNPHGKRFITAGYVRS